MFVPIFINPFIRKSTRFFYKNDYPGCFTVRKCRDFEFATDAIRVADYCSLAYQIY